jgi:hypothetical protein
MNILICSIIRNEARFLDTWHAQIKEIATTFKDDSISLSVFENDSTDGSFAKLAAYDWSFLSNYTLTSHKLNAPFFHGGKHPQRTQLLAACRNRCISQFPFLKDVCHVLFIEADITYTIDVADKIIHHEKHYGQAFDVFTPKSVHADRPGPNNIYDSWGTRKTQNDVDWHDEYDQNTAGHTPMWAVFHCFMMLNAEPIKKSIAFGGFNERLGIPDCDPVVLCENFRKAGYDKIYWDPSLEVAHTVNEI